MLRRLNLVLQFKLLRLVFVHHCLNMLRAVAFHYPKQALTSFGTIGHRLVVQMLGQMLFLHLVHSAVVQSAEMLENVTLVLLADDQHAFRVEEAFGLTMFIQILNS